MTKTTTRVCVEYAGSVNNEHYRNYRYADVKFPPRIARQLFFPKNKTKRFPVWNLVLISTKSFYFSRIQWTECKLFYFTKNNTKQCRTSPHFDVENAENSRGKLSHSMWTRIRAPRRAVGSQITAQQTPQRQQVTSTCSSRVMWLEARRIQPNNMLELSRFSGKFHRTTHSIMLSGTSSCCAVPTAPRGLLYQASDKDFWVLRFSETPVRFITSVFLIRTFFGDKPLGLRRQNFAQRYNEHI